MSPAGGGSILTDLASSGERLRDRRICDGPRGSTAAALRAALEVRGVALQLWYSPAIDRAEMSLGRYCVET